MIATFGLEANQIRRNQFSGRVASLSRKFLRILKLFGFRESSELICQEVLDITMLLVLLH